MGKTERVHLLEAVAVTVELTGTDLSEAAMRAFAGQLEHYPLDQVLPALSRCQRELTGKLSLAAVISRLDDGRPGVEEAWAMLPMDEATTVVWTEEMSQAWGIARTLIVDGDTVAARMAFKEKYSQLIQIARSEGRAPKWTPSLGHDAQGRETVLLEAVRLGRLSAPHVSKLLPHFDMPHSSISLPRLQ